MADRIIEDVDAFKEWLNQQPLCAWSAAKGYALATGQQSTLATTIHRPDSEETKKKVIEDDELAAALRDMM